MFKRTLRSLQQQKEGSGKYFLLYKTAEKSGKFNGVDLNDRGKFLNKLSFLQALIDNLSQRLYSNVSMSSHEEFVSLLGEFDILDSKKWPSGLESPWVEGERKLESLCERFSLPYDQHKVALRDFIDDVDNVPQDILKFQAILNSLPVSSADCERGFSTMNIVCNDTRNRLTVEHISNLMFISLLGPPVKEFDPEPYVKEWLKTHRSADDTRTRVTTAKKSMRYKKLWKLF